MYFDWFISWVKFKSSDKLFQIYRLMHLVIVACRSLLLWTLHLQCTTVYVCKLHPLCTGSVRCATAATRASEGNACLALLPASWRCDQRINNQLLKAVACIKPCVSTNLWYLLAKIKKGMNCDYSKCLFLWMWVVQHCNVYYYSNHKQNQHPAHLKVKERTCPEKKHSNVSHDSSVQWRDQISFSDFFFKHVYIGLIVWLYSLVMVIQKLMVFNTLRGSWYSVCVEWVLT